jgi:hypothetical protein
MYPSKYTLQSALISDNDNTQKSRSVQSVVVFTPRFTQNASVVFKINASGISMQQIVYSANLE